MCAFSRKFSPQDLEELKSDNLLLSYHLNENPIDEKFKKDKCSKY